MIVVDTVFKDGRNFRSVREFSKPLKGRRYIEGAVLIRVDDVEIAGEEFSDLVDQLWCYVSDGVEKVSKGESFECYFPDQPIRLAFDVIGNRVRIRLADEDVRTRVVPQGDFLAEFSRAGVEFFNQLERLAPDFKETCARYRSKLLPFLERRSSPYPP